MKVALSATSDGSVCFSEAPGTPISPLPIYLDYHSTTPVDPRVAHVVLRYMLSAFGNANSADHSFGDEAEEAVATARIHVGSVLGATSSNIVFTSGATESINLALQGLAAAFSTQGRTLRVAYTPVEHRSVMDTLGVLARRSSVHLRALHVDEAGRLDESDLENVCHKGVDLVCVMAANNEIGTVYPLERVAAVAREAGALTFTDATQACGKLPLAFDAWGIDLLACTAHKLYGPKGVGALVVKRDVTLEPLIHGGGHQRGMRAGTLNVPGIAGFGEACRLRIFEMADDEPRIARLRDWLQDGLAEGIENLIINGAPEARLAGNLHISIPDVPNTAVIARVRAQVAIATGAACSSGIEAPSHVLKAIGLSPCLQDGALRLGLGKYTSSTDVAEAADIIVAAVKQIRAEL